MFPTQAKLKNQELIKKFFSFINLKWIGIILLQIIVGLSCIFLPWYFIAILFPFFVFITFLHIRIKLWAYILVFFIPLVGVKYPNIYLHKRGFTPGDAFPILLILSVAASLSLMLLISSKLRKNIKNPLLIPILLLVCYSLLTLFWSPANVWFNLYYFLFLIIDISLYYFLFHIIDNNNFHRRLMWCLVFSGLFLSIQIILVFVNSLVDKPIIIINGTAKILDWLYIDYLPAFSEKELTVHGFFMGTQETGMVLNFIFFTALGLLLTEKKRLNIWFLRVMIPILIISIFFTGTKSGSWTLVIVINIFVFLSLKFRENIFRNLLIFYTIFLLIFLSTAILKRHGGENRLTNVTTQEKSSLGKRIGYWKVGFRELDKRGLTFLGLGIAGYKYCTVNKSIAHAHNVYLSMLFDFGLMGIIVFCLAILILTKMFLKLLKHQKTYLQNMSFASGINLIAIGTIGLVYISYYMDFLWFVLGLTSSTFHLAQRELLEKTNNVPSCD